MEGIQTFRDLVVWQKTHQLVLLVYRPTKKFPRDELFVLVSQARRATISVPANIVEGFRRRSIRDSLNFYRIADASLEELKYHFLLARDLAYVSNEEYQQFVQLSEEAGRLLTRWIQSQRTYMLSS